jgi:hypothetical protein
VVLVQPRPLPFLFVWAEFSGYCGKIIFYSSTPILGKPNARDLKFRRQIFQNSVGRGMEAQPWAVSLCGLFRTGVWRARQATGHLRRLPAAGRRKIARSAIDCRPVVRRRVQGTPPVVAMQVRSVRNYSKVRPVRFMDGYC